MNAAKYMDTLNTHLLPQLNEWFAHDNGVFQQDNAPCHKAATVIAMLEHEGICILDWPPYSPDLSPIENLWAILKQKVHTKHYISKEAQIVIVKDIWSNDIDIKNACKTLIQGMPRRIHACIAAKGGPLKY
jgi:hypothetical protein